MAKIILMSLVSFPVSCCTLFANFPYKKSIKNVPKKDPTTKNNTGTVSKLNKVKASKATITPQKKGIANILKADNNSPVKKACCSFSVFASTEVLFFLDSL